jgi:methylmalonyl-CoA mutase cobalamin-binding subunit
VGNRWADGRFTIADEHLLSAALRNLLDGIVRIHGPVRGPAVVLAAPSGEHHEFGLLFTALRVAEAGLAPWYLGPDLPAAEIVAAARRARAVVVGLAVVNSENARAAAEAVQHVERSLPAGTELWLGGSHAPSLAQHLQQSRARLLHDHNAFERELERLCASLPPPI